MIVTSSGAGSAAGAGFDPAQLARQALTEQTEAEALPVVAAAAERVATDARLWQWTGLLLRALDRREEAIAALRRAQRLQPSDVSIAHGLAHVTLEAGLDAVALFERAAALAPGRRDVLLGMTAAHFAAGAPDRATAGLSRRLHEEPQWLDGHEYLSKLRWMLGETDAFANSYEQALGSGPRPVEFWVSYIEALLRAKAYDRAGDVLARARRAVPHSATLDMNEAILRSETGDVSAADRLFARLMTTPDETIILHAVRHLLTVGRIDQAARVIDSWLDRPARSDALWPYAGTVWRLLGDPRHTWLEGQDGLVAVIDLANRLPPLDQLAERLRILHRARFQNLDQSVRGGTQTDGVLFANIDPLIQATRAVVVDAVRGYIDRLPLSDPRHPTLSPRRDRPPRFSGSWSVRLQAAGHHANHVHPAGWISSALYVVLPDGDGHAGWLTVGMPQDELGITLEPMRRIEPRPGRLVLFPSTMWHGTVPFEVGERLTIAFDVAHPAP